MSDLKAWSNGYEVVAAESAEQAVEVLRATGMYAGDEEALEGDGWKELASDKFLHEEDGKRTDETVGDVVRESNEPRHIWSVAC